MLDRALQNQRLYIALAWEGKSRGLSRSGAYFLRSASLLQVRGRRDVIRSPRFRLP